MEKDKEVIGYCCLTDWTWEIGESWDGTEIYNSIESLRDARCCVDSCGIVKVRVKLEEVVLESNFGLEPTKEEIEKDGLA